MNSLDDVVWGCLDLGRFKDTRDLAREVLAYIYEKPGEFHEETMGALEM